MAANFRDMTSPQLRAMASALHGITLPEDMSHTEMQIILMKELPIVSNGNRTTVTGNVTRIEDILPPGLFDRVATCDALSDYLASHISYAATNSTDVNYWILKNIIPKVPDHSVSYGPHIDENAYQVTICGTALSVQWLFV